jgi:hypothetical protein
LNEFKSIKHQKVSIEQEKNRMVKKKIIWINLNNLNLKKVEEIKFLKEDQINRATAMEFVKNDLISLTTENEILKRNNLNLQNETSSLNKEKSELLRNVSYLSENITSLKEQVINLKIENENKVFLINFFKLIDIDKLNI